ncbi:MAG: nucleotidyltransferase family protein [Candidatus Aenigmarchaeota archaeon]|nr:nucleotidyltransferase family protein [Candidatus Aenigmarchaeota archaeon]
MQFSGNEKLLINFAAESIKCSDQFQNFSINTDKWIYILSVATALRVNSQLLGWLEKLNLKEQIPQDIHKALLSARIQANYRNAKLVNCYDKIHERFSRAAIIVRPIKGLWILKHGGLNCFDRITSDIDILVPEDRLKKAAGILCNMGYKQDPVKSKRTKNKPSSSGHHLVPFRKGEISVELHYRVFPSSSKELINNIFEENDIKDHYIIILYHFLRHSNRGDINLKWLYDLFLLTDYMTSEELTRIILDSERSGIKSQVIHLMRILADWKLLKNPQYPVIQIINLLQNCSISQETELRSAIDINLLETAFPTIEYLRFIYPNLKHLPAFILYPIRWAKLSEKAVQTRYLHKFLSIRRN